MLAKVMLMDIPGVEYSRFCLEWQARMGCSMRSVHDRGGYEEFMLFDGQGEKFILCREVKWDANIPFIVSSSKAWEDSDPRVLILQTPMIIWGGTISRAFVLDFLKELLNEFGGFWSEDTGGYPYQGKFQFYPKGSNWTQFAAHPQITGASWDCIFQSLGGSIRVINSKEYWDAMSRLQEGSIAKTSAFQ